MQKWIGHVPMMSNIISNLIVFEIFAYEHECLCTYTFTCTNTCMYIHEYVIPGQLGHAEIGNRAEILIRCSL
jgi:hypothetical protein